MNPWPKHSEKLGPKGKFLCRCGCGREVAPPRTVWFSKKCIEATALKCNWGKLRRFVLIRDKYGCAKVSEGQCSGGKEVDHIIPLIEGGTHAVENLRTLCSHHHKQETAALAARRAAKRKHCTHPTLDLR